MAETELLLAASSPTTSIQTEEYVVLSSKQLDEKEESKIFVPLAKIPLLNACSLRKDQGGNSIRKSLENFTDNNTNTNNDGSPSTITKSRSRSCGFISDVKSCNEPLEVSINNKEFGVVQATTSAQASPLNVSNTRIFTANRYVITCLLYHETHFINTLQSAVLRCIGLKSYYLESIFPSWKHR